MGRLACSLITICAATVGVATMAHAQTEVLTIVSSKDGDFSAEIQATTGWCQPNTAITVRGKDDEVFLDHSKMARLANGVQAALSRKCPQVQTIIINGFVDDVFVYRATMARPKAGPSWPLIETAVAVVPEMPVPPLPPQEQMQQPIPQRPDFVPGCDREAAHPQDPTKPPDVMGVSDDMMHAGRALELCEGALEAAPENPRLMYQLARAYLMYDRPVEGVELLTEAAEAGHPVAIASLGDIALYGLLGDDPDPALARDLYRQAAALGFAPAASLANDIKDDAIEDAGASVAPVAQFFEPQRMARLLSGKAIEDNESYLRQFIYAGWVIDGISHQCPDAKLDSVSRDKVMSLLVSRMGEENLQREMAAANDQIMANLRQAGLDDGYALALSVNCDSPQIEAVRKAMRQAIQ